MAEILNVETGVKTYAVNGGFEISYNPTDSAFVEKLFNAFNELDKKQDAYKDESAKTGDRHQVFELARKMDAEMRAIIDDIFGAPVCNQVFGGMNVYAYGNGLPVWANLVLAVMDTVDTSFAREQKLTNARIKKYTDKYHK